MICLNQIFNLILLREKLKIMTEKELTTEEKILPVSYTHLDVYKRQPFSNAPHGAFLQNKNVLKQCSNRG